MTHRNMPVVSTNTDLHETLALLTSQLHPDANHKEDLVFLKGVFSEKSLGYLMKIHDKLKQYEKQSPSPVLHSASCLAEDVSAGCHLQNSHFISTFSRVLMRTCVTQLTEELKDGQLEEDEKELLLLLSAPHLKAVLSAHDTVAQKNFDPMLPPLPEDVDDDLEEESVKIVRLVKNKEPLGATIRRDEVTGAVIVARIMRGGAADRSGLVHVGDELREVNGNLITHKRPDEISHILSQSQGSITLKIIPAIVEEDKMKESRVYLRALFDYVPFEDRATPCQEAGLPFKRGDILQVVSQEDATWWQAKRVGDCNLRAALIPSTHFQERRLRYRLKTGSFPASMSPIVTTYERAEQDDADVEGKDIAGLRRSFRLKKDRHDSPGEPRTPDANHADFLIYEEVTLYLPRPGERPRLIVLLGSLGARIAELKQKVIAENPRLYGLAVPHTTRPRKSHEREGVEYHFITKAAFEADMHNGKFIEYGEYKDNLYGTSLESIHGILDQNKICLVDVQPEALLILRTSAFKPFIIFVRPTVFDSERKSLSSCSSLHSMAIMEHDIQDMRQSAEKMEQCYGHWVDYVLVKEDPVSAIAELHVILERVRMEPQWVPLSWVRT
ncbi:MAGUK p55 subfamily member 3-like isoform X2 [Dunckerocampus dactyliophorus]|uniref:MAGUK p55 subfamily member 3-like isoform X2 n=1 Tax=Dunckerocampus dactyliophorus TaxID=161453 RepID=UPI00240507E7|nr:MAGUK p55 subfamily member 3-like isoform X2 [Dunckerocampus dactyliophorus]